jgi:nitroreductase
LVFSCRTWSAASRAKIGGNRDNDGEVKKMRVSDDAFDLVFRKARTYNAWLPRPVPDELLQQLYDTLKWGPTSANISPARFVCIRSTTAKERLRPSLAPGNVEKTMAAPITVIIAYDLKFYDKLPRLFPHYPAMREGPRLDLARHAPWCDCRLLALEDSAA